MTCQCAANTTAAPPTLKVGASVTVEQEGLTVDGLGRAVSALNLAVTAAAGIAFDEYRANHSGSKRPVRVEIDELLGQIILIVDAES